MEHKVFIKTFGCQMNKYDSELICGILNNAGFSNTIFLDDADIVLVNTCSVRAHAAERAYSNLRDLSRLKKERKIKILGVCGCLAESEKERFLKKIPNIDLIIGPNYIRNINLYVERALNGESPIVAIGDITQDWKIDFNIYRQSDKKAYVTVIKGCNSFCSYCIVPYVRGREQSRPIDDILNEIKNLIKSGYKEICLLGQNVNSYGKDLYENIDFTDLLKRIDEIKGDFWIRFLTSHPKDIPTRLIDTVSKSNKICKYFHLPVQSGSDRILKLMNRGYTVSYFKDKIREIREKIKNVSISSDIIVGFPGETEEDFNETVELCKEIQFDSVFTFKYSVREGTTAAKLEDSVKKEEKEKRAKIIDEIQKDIALKLNQMLVGTVQRVLVDSKVKGKTIVGRTEGNKEVFFSSSNDLKSINDFVDVKITKACPFSLRGILV